MSAGKKPLNPIRRRSARIQQDPPEDEHDTAPAPAEPQATQQQQPLDASRRRSARVRGQSPIVEQDAGATVAEEDAIEAEDVAAEGEDPAANQLIQEMNKAAGKSPGKRGRPTGSGRKRKRLDPRTAADSTPGTPTRGPSAKVLEIPAPQSAAISTGKLKRKPPPTEQRPAAVTQRDVFDFQGDEAGPSFQQPKTRKLNQFKPLNPSPLRKHGVVDLTGVRGVDLDDTAPSSRAGRTKRTRRRSASDDEDENETEQRGERQTGHTNEPSTDAGRPPRRNDPISRWFDGDREEQGDDGHDESGEEVDAGLTRQQSAVEELELQEREREERIRQKCCEGVESHIQVFGCSNSWGSLLVAARDYREKVREFVDHHSGGGTSRKYKPKTEVGRIATEALDGLLELYQGETMDWAAEITAATAVRQATRQIIDKESPSKRGLDLYLSVLPRYVPILKAALQRVQPKPTSTAAQLAPLTRLLTYTSEALERARNWEPRPRAFDGYKILALVRDDYYLSIKAIQAAYDTRLSNLRRGEEAERDRLTHMARVAHQDEEDRLWLQTKEQRIQNSRNTASTTLQKMRLDARLKEEQRQEAKAKLLRRPLNEITQKVVGTVHDIDDFEEDGTRRIYRDSQELVATQPQPWSQEELAALWQALMKQYPKENRFTMIHQRHGKEMPGRTVDEIRQLAVLQKRGCMDLVTSLPPAEAAKWKFLMSVPG